MSVWACALSACFCLLFWDVFSKLALCWIAHFFLSLVLSLFLSCNVDLCVSFLPDCSFCCLITCLPAGLFACLLACLPACLLACLPACLLACLVACLPACLPACLLACWLARLLACLLFLSNMCAFSSVLSYEAWLSRWNIICLCGCFLVC